MAKNKYFLNLYKLYLKDNKLPAAGLCNCVTEKKEILEMMGPQKGNFTGSCVFWACGDTWEDLIVRRYGFTELRQTIILFCAALNNEL